MLIDRKTVSMLASMPDDRLWHTLRLMAAGMGMELPERKRRRIDYEALRRTLMTVTDADIARANDIAETYRDLKKGGRSL